MIIHHEGDQIACHSNICRHRGFNCIDSDELRARQWKVAVENCQLNLERDDLRQITDIVNPQDVERQIEVMQKGLDSTTKSHELAMLLPSISHLENLSTMLSGCLTGEVSFSIFWGMLYLSVKVRMNN